MIGTPVARHKTALRRTGLSRPISRALTDGLLIPDSTVFDYGCGKGDDIRHLRTLGYAVDGWDPVHRPNVKRRCAEVVNLGYVLNVIENQEERAQTLHSAWALATQLLVVSARMTWDGRDLAGRPLGDGMITRTGLIPKVLRTGRTSRLDRTDTRRQTIRGCPGHLLRVPRRSGSTTFRGVKGIHLPATHHDRPPGPLPRTSGRARAPSVLHAGARPRRPGRSNSGKTNSWRFRRHWAAWAAPSACSGKSPPPIIGNKWLTGGEQNS
jgi:hypothetical protein